MAEEKKDGYTVINVNLQEPFENWKEVERERKDGSKYASKIEPAGISDKEFIIPNKAGEEKAYRSVCVARGTEINGEKIGGSHYLVPADAVKDIDPNHKNAAEWEKNLENPEKHKKIILGKDFNLNFAYKNYDPETKESKWVVKATATAAEYKKALDNRKKNNRADNEREPYNPAKNAQDVSKGQGAHEKAADKDAR